MIETPQTETPRRTQRSPWLLLPTSEFHGNTMATGVHSQTSGDWTVVSAIDRGPPGLRLSPEGWTYTTGSFTHAAAWYATDTDGTLRALGSDPATIAEAIGAELDRSALVDDLLLGFRPDGRSPYTGILPCGASNPMVYAPTGVTPAPIEAGGIDLDSLGHRIAEAMNDGACIELTGGVDSRLLLALGLGAGGKPTKSFTIGLESDPDVRVAREIAELLGMEHRAIRVEQDEHRLVEDTTAFVAESGYVCNAAAYGWLPTIFRTLGLWRDAQLSGVGGEIGEGFYYTGFDPVFQVLNSPRLWLRARAVVDGGRWSSLFEGGFGDRLAKVARDRPELNESKPWRLRTDDFYTHARIHGWAIPVIRASAAWYQPITPFLSNEYLAWSRSLSAEQRHNRAAQHELIGRTSPELAGIAYAKQLEAPAGGKLARKLGKAKRLASRVLPRPTAQPEQWASTARSLMRSLDGADSVVDRLRTLGGVRVDRVAEVLRSDPSTAAHAIGALLTMAHAIERHSGTHPNGLWQD